MKRIVALFIMIYIHHSGFSAKIWSVKNFIKPDFLQEWRMLTSQEPKDTIKFHEIKDFEDLLRKKRSKMSEYLIKSFASEFEGMNQRDICLNPSRATINIKGIGGCKIFTISMSDSLPENVARKAYLLYCLRKREGAILFLDTLLPIKVNKKDTSYFIGGSLQFRGIGYFNIFSGINGGQLFKVFNSGDTRFCDGGLATYNSSLDCQCYDPFMLTFKNQDINNDNLNDLEFDGIILRFCKGLEMGYGRDNRKPLKREQVRLVFLTHLKGEKIYWTLLKNGACEKINSK